MSRQLNEAEEAHHSLTHHVVDDNNCILSTPEATCHVFSGIFKEISLLTLIYKCRLAGQITNQLAIQRRASYACSIRRICRMQRK